MEAVPQERPVRLVLRDDDLRRNRLTVAFRLVLAIPHLLLVLLWGIAAFVVAFVLWLAILIEGKAPTMLHDFVAGYVRYATHVGAYVFLAADRYPAFNGRPGYAVDVEIEPPARQSRWSALFRLALALPALALASALGGSFATGPSWPGTWTWGREERAGFWWGGFSLVGGVASVAAFLCWFAVLARGHAPRGLRDLIAYALGYNAQAGGYLLLLTSRYPSSDPALVEPFAELPAHPVRIVVTDGLERPRLTVVFRLLLAIPHLVWLTLWTIAVFVAALVAWVVALATGAIPASFRRFFAAYVRYDAHVNAFVYLVGRRFPGFTGVPGSYGIDVEIEPTERHSRWTVLGRFFLAFPALLLTSALSGVLAVLAVLGWFYAVVTARMPEGLRDLGAVCIRYAAQTYAYLLLLTDRYPYAAPVLHRRPEREDVPPPPAEDTL